MPRTLTLNATEKLRSLILSGGFAGHTHLTEQMACDALAMSRTPVRAALQALAQEGVLDYQPHRGFRVRSSDPDALMDAYAVRATLEGLAVRTLAEQGPDRDTIAILAGCVDEGARLLQNKPFDTPAWRAMNERFHTAIAVAAGNDTLTAALRLAQGAPLAAMSVIADLRPEPDLSLLHQAQADHEAILLALRTGQSARAEMRMREHVVVAGELLADALAEKLAELGEVRNARHA
jgi:GntR family transcriptional regulator of vanillate catabolism